MENLRPIISRGFIHYLETDYPLYLPFYLLVLQRRDSEVPIRALQFLRELWQRFLRESRGTIAGILRAGG